jgi:hypothetical protein
LVAIISPDSKTPEKGKQCIKIEKRDSFIALDVLDPPAPVAVEGNATLQVTMDDNGKPGSSDTIGITVWNKSGGLWFTSKWNGVKAIEQLLNGGNLVVH